MVVTCPNCSKRYMLDDALLPKEGRQVRCKACYHVWRQDPDLSSSMKTLPLIGIEDMRELSSPTSSSWMRWVLFFAFLLSLLSFFVFGRNFIVRYVPESVQVYDFLGLQAALPGVGLSIHNATSLASEDGSVELIQVAGDVINISDRVRPIPPLKIKLLGDVSNPKCLKNHEDTECILDYWEHHLSENNLLPGEQIHFETDPRPKVEGAIQIVVDF